jgi:ubiquinone/menaquinone biosynthesis C-methylase UbiE
MSFFISCRDLFSPPKRELLKIGIIQENSQLLDYGCGPGGYTIAAAKIVGEKGKVYAADYHPLAEKYVKRRSKKNKLSNIDFIHTDCATGLPDASIDHILFYDILHMINQPENNLQEFHRVLKPKGTLLMSNHHMNGENILQQMTSSNLFKLSIKINSIYVFEKV